MGHLNRCYAAAYGTCSEAAVHNNRNQRRLKFHHEMSKNLVITNVQLFKHEALVKNMSMKLTHDSGTIIKVPFYY